MKLLRFSKKKERRISSIHPSIYPSLSDREKKIMTEGNIHTFGKLPDHLLVEIFVRVPISEWAQITCVSKQWASVFHGECLWQTAIARAWPSASHRKRWPGPIPRGVGRRRYVALYVSQQIFALDGEVDELIGHTYLYLKEQLELSILPPPSGVLHGTMIAVALYYSLNVSNVILSILFMTLFLQADQFLACGKSRDKAHELASQIWLAVINNLEENQQTFLILKRLAQEGDFFLPYPYSRSYQVLWRIFEKLFTDFRDCFEHMDYYDVLASAKSRFQPIPPTWLGY